MLYAQKLVDKLAKRIYNNMCYVYFESKIIIFINGKKLKGGAKNEKNLSTKKETKKKRTRIQKENENC